MAHEISLPPGIERTRDWKRVGEITAEAFRDDPFNRWIYGGRMAGMEVLFTTLARKIYANSGVMHLAARGGAAMWMPPRAHEDIPLSTYLVLGARVFLASGARAVRRVVLSGSAMEAAHPKRRHWYLFTIGTAGAARGQGIGKALLRPVLDHCDRSRLPAYLENSNPANSGFYMAHGFERREMIEVADDAPPLEAMWREPRSGKA